MSSCKSKFFLTIYLIQVVGVIITLSVLISLSKNNEDDYIYLDSLITNWNRTMYEGFKIKEAGEQCDDGYYNILENEYWPGTETGCACYSTIYKGSCSSLGKAYPCTTIAKFEPIAYQQWRSSIICAKPFITLNGTQSYNYFDLLDTTDNNYCQERCGFLGSKGWRDEGLCKRGSCPIGKIKIIGINDPIPIGYEKYEQESGKFIKLLYETNSESNTISSNFVVSSAPTCIDPRYRFYSYRYPLYPFYTFSSNGRCPQNYTDDSYMSIDSYRLNYFLNENPKISVALNLLVSYDIASTENIQLATLGYIGVLSSVRRKIKEQGSNAFLSRLKNERFNPIFSIMCLTASCVTLIGMFLLYFSNICFREKTKVSFLIVLILLQNIFSILEYSLFNFAFTILFDNFTTVKGDEILNEQTNLKVIFYLAMTVMIMNISLFALFFPKFVYVVFFKAELNDRFNNEYLVANNQVNNQNNIIQNDQQQVFEQNNNELNPNNYNSSLLGTVPTANFAARISLERPDELVPDSQKKSNVYEPPPEFNE